MTSRYSGRRALLSGLIERTAPPADPRFPCRFTDRHKSRHAHRFVLDQDDTACVHTGNDHTLCIGFTKRKYSLAFPPVGITRPAQGDLSPIVGLSPIAATAFAPHSIYHYASGVAVYECTDLMEGSALMAGSTEAHGNIGNEMSLRGVVETRQRRNPTKQSPRRAFTPVLRRLLRLWLATTFVILQLSGNYHSYK